MLVRDQLSCAKILEAAYERTRSLGLEQTRMPLEDLSSALEIIAEQLGTLTEWDLRPARVESLMKACAEFMSRRGESRLDDQELFGHLSLPAIEMICEAWSRLLDPFWEQAKQEVRDSFAYEDLPKGYIAIQAILQKLDGDARHADEIHEMMSKGPASSREPVFPSYRGTATPQALIRSGTTRSRDYPMWMPPPAGIVYNDVCGCPLFGKHYLRFSAGSSIGRVSGL
ncbi:hypothetical protein [Roseinatronobacter sp. S2]|uniref:hypothetical protein n=1 Tax=Roseinatronobacter sp. S2 TaxID=3035471 RepID=UPI002410B036|nr:hypothetical protein [Roseinatronobacter sp. S2]WFE77145.1 hypothetical protein P8S53_20830 [Roseinatronobacter sp. S2]